ncbi:MAG: DinB superfamily protein, partial [Gemmatimonadetes bacterium]|nr:DinB family protein [Gemmatimonadota bacterium]NIR80799.1 DinB family protein [Gemmatimonadota bacterium]NIT89619.1 DinB family protein [Gemmatimonadota bacterium]NIU33399.1 DinB family protein [Gemmatimonadota bacterium]NIU37691.1 DinB superfamily protein [Gemmatimonadota bacterium]
MSELGSHVAHILSRDLDRLAEEVRAYPDEEGLWLDAPGIPNPGGTLALHLAGNLLHYVGALLGASGYERDRDAEFFRRDVPRKEILDRIAEARQAVESVLPGLDGDELRRPFPQPPERMQGVETGAFLLHLISHL